MDNVVSAASDLGEEPASESGRPEFGDLMDNFGVIDTADLKVRDTSWMKAFKGDLRTLDVIGLWRAAGLRIVLRGDGVSYLAQCPNRKEHSDPEATSGTLIYKRPGAFPSFFCGRTKCRGGRFSTGEALLRLGAELVDVHCGERFVGHETRGGGCSLGGRCHA